MTEDRRKQKMPRGTRDNPALLNNWRPFINGLIGVVSNHPRQRDFKGPAQFVYVEGECGDLMPGAKLEKLVPGELVLIDGGEVWCEIGNKLEL